MTPAVLVVRPQASTLLLGALTLAVALGALPAAADGPSPAAPATYQLSAQLVLSPDSATATYLHDPREGGPPNPAVTVPVGQQARAAFTAAAARLFREVASAGAPLQIEVSVGSGALVSVGGTWRASIGYEVVATADGGAQVARWALSGVEALGGRDGADVVEAFASAARSAARDFERGFDDSPGVGAWLAARGLQRRAPPAGEAPRQPVARSGRVFFGDLEVGTTGGLTSGARAGLSGDHLYVQARAEHWESTFRADPPNRPREAPGTYAATLVGLELGLVRRIGETLEARLGVGLHRFTADFTKEVWTNFARGDTAILRMPKSAVTESVAASLVYASRRVTASQLRGRIGLELRLLAGTICRLDALSRTVDAGSFSALLTVGAELPVGF